jgi:transcription elongation factor GreA
MANEQRFPMTPRGLRALRDELKHLKEVERPKNVRDIEEARAHGDLRENAEFSAAKERQAFIEGRSRELEGTIALSDVIDPSKLSGTRVVFGATVKLADTDTGDEITYSIVGDHEGDIKLNRLAISAPLARAMIGREQGDTVVLRNAKGSREYQIVEVRFEPADD